MLQSKTEGLSHYLCPPERIPSIWAGPVEVFMAQAKGSLLGFCCVTHFNVLFFIEQRS